MKSNQKIVAAAVIALGSLFAASAVTAEAAPPAPTHQPEMHKKPQPAHHAKNDWMKKGGHMPKSARGPEVDYRRHGLHKPPHGYHWVRHDDSYVLMDMTSGLISSIIHANH